MNSQIEQEMVVEFNYSMQSKEVRYFNILLLSKPEVMRLRIAEATCPKGHKVKVIKLFALDEKVCPKHNIELNKTAIYSQIEVYNFAVQAKETKLNIFIPTTQLKDELDIHNRINVQGFDVSVQTKSKGIFTRGVFVEASQGIEKWQEENNTEKLHLTKKDMIDLFLSNRPRLNYPEEILSAYKHALFLPLVHCGLNMLVVGEPGTLKTEAALQAKEISGGAYADVPNATEVGLIGMALKNFDGGFTFEGGAIFDAKNNTLFLDEAEKVMNAAFYRHLNGILANHNLDIRKGNIKYHDDKFFMSFEGFGNPIHSKFQTMPKVEIEQTFRHNKEFLSRMHLIFALKGKGSDPRNKKALDLSPMKAYIRQARQLQITEEDLSQEVKDEIYSLYKENPNDERFHKKLTDLVIAEAKFSLHKKATVGDVREIEKLIHIQNRLLHGI